MSTLFKQQSSFTLIELLIVIGILAILTAAVVLVLNPTELLKQGRDSTRASDLASLTHAIALLQSQVEISLGTASTVYISIPDTNTTCSNLSLPSLPSGYTYHCVPQANLRNIDGSGWLPINFTQSSIQTLSALPLDPINTTSSNLYYTYIPGGSYELTALMESDKGSLPAQSDGGTLPGVLEKGTHIGLTPPLRDRGLVGYWTFDEGTGTTAKDWSGHNNTGTWSGSGTHWASGKFGGAGLFNGSSDYLDIPSSTILDFDNVDFSISFWINTSNVSVTAGFIEKNPAADAGRSNYALWQNSGGSVYFYVGNGTAGQYGSLKATPVITQGTWLNFVAVFKAASDTMEIYENGYLNGQVTTTINPMAVPGILRIGKLDSIYYFNGYLDDVRIYNRALSTSEIQAIYNATK